MKSTCPSKGERKKKMWNRCMHTYIYKIDDLAHMMLSEISNKNTTCSLSYVQAKKEY